VFLAAQQEVPRTTSEFKDLRIFRDLPKNFTIFPAIFGMEVESPISEAIPRGGRRFERLAEFEATNATAKHLIMQCRFGSGSVESCSNL
jgi:hypothetical protein